jgi:hypothetical protein
MKQIYRHSNMTRSATVMHLRRWKRVAGMKTKANSVRSRSDGVGSMIQPLSSNDGHTGRAFEAKKRDL